VASFTYDTTILAAVRAAPKAIADVIQALETIDATCVDGDGLKWFNRLYLQVTRAVQDRVASGGFRNPVFLRELDVQFARLYFDALVATFSGEPCPACWTAPLAVRGDTRIARIQFALAGVNAHINHDLPEALVTTMRALGVVPMVGSPEHQDYTAVDSVLMPLIDQARQTFHVRLLGDPMPIVPQIENTLAAFGLVAARAKAWNNGEVLFHLPDNPPLAPKFLDSLDGLASFAGKALLVPAP
jgi:hypothetical protein